MNKLDDLIFISAQPWDNYYKWQNEVMITNFLKKGIKNIEILVWYPKGADVVARWIDIMEKYPEVKFYFYEDKGANIGVYVPILRPHILKQHFLGHKDRLKGKTFFYHDSDIIFREVPDFEKLIQDDICYMSNTSSYTDYDYFKRKEEQNNLPENTILNELSRIGDVSIDVIKSYTGNTGGAQSLLKNIDHLFWEDVEKMCEQLRLSFCYSFEGSINRKYFKDENEGIQSWAADMFALNLALWKRDIKTSTTPLLDFSWSPENAASYFSKPIMHNAGVTGPGVYFFKGQWINQSPLDHDFPMPPEDSANYYYVQAILDVKNNVKN